MKKKREIWNNFKHILLNAKKVILLDAFITTKTINFITNLETEVSLGSLLIYQRKDEPSTRTVEIMKSFELTMLEIIYSLKKNKKCFIFYPYKKKTYYNQSMEMIHEMLQKETGKKGIFYNADIDDKIKGGLKNVNKSWSKYDFVITNNIVTCGVNYEKKDFDCAYIFVGGHNAPRDIIQVSYRARFLSSEIIKICYMGTMMQPTTYQIDTSVVNCPIYTKLINSILVEKHSPLQKTLQLFCNKAHYKFEINPSVISADLKKYIKELVDECGVGFSYENVEDINSQYAKIIEQNCFNQTATMIEKIMLQKYFFKKSFKETAQKICLESLEYEIKIPIIEHAWNKQLSFFFSRNYELLIKPDNIFNAIKELNGNDGIFPQDIKKTKLNDKILDDIFKQFNFKFITRKSSKDKILKEVFNTYFARKIIDTKYTTDKHKNLEYKVEHEYYNELYVFARDYSRYEVYQPELDCQDNYTIDLGE